MLLLRSASWMQMIQLRHCFAALCTTQNLQAAHFSRQDLQQLQSCWKIIRLISARCDSQKLPNAPHQGFPKAFHWFPNTDSQIQVAMESHTLPVLIPRQCRRGQKMPKSNLTRLAMPKVWSRDDPRRSNLDHLLPQTWHSPPQKVCPTARFCRQTDSQNYSWDQSRSMRWIGTIIKGPMCKEIITYMRRYAMCVH